MSNSVETNKKDSAIIQWRASPIYPNFHQHHLPAAANPASPPYRPQHICAAGRGAFKDTYQYPQAVF
jgi:hypothetical protein